MSQSVTLDDIYQLFRESERQRQETERLLQQSLERSRVEFQSSLQASRAEFDRRMENTEAAIVRLRTDLEEAIARSRTELAEELAQSRTEIEEKLARSRRELEEELAQSRTELAEELAQSRTAIEEANAQSRAEFDRRMAEFHASSERSQQRWEQSQQRWEQFQQQQAQAQEEYDRRIARVEAIAARASQAVESLSSRWGRFVENMVAPAALRLFQERGFAVQEVYQRVRSARGSAQLEIDILVVDDTVAIVIEVKSRLTQDHIRRALKNLERFKTAFPHYQDYEIYGCVAGIEIDGEVDIYAENQGLFVIKQAGDSVCISSPLDFQPRSW
jgi:biotin operon repressor/Holliday junction resolvase-like predicted endonuclease